MSQQIQFKSGDLQAFTATRTFKLAQTGIDVVEGTEILFDGAVVEYAGNRMQLPTLRGAIKVGWLVPSTDYDPMVVQRPISAGVQVRPAEGGNPLEPRTRTAIAAVNAEETEVASIQNHATTTRTRNATNYRRDVNHPDVEVGGSEGRTVRTVSTPAKQSASTDDAARAIRAAESVKVQPGRGLSREEALERMSPEEREEYLSQTRARKMQYVDEPVIVGKTKTAATVESEGFSTKLSVGNGLDIADLGGTGVAGKDQESVIESEGMRFTTTNGPKREAKAATPLDPRRVIAKKICADFPDNYDFDSSVRKKIARLQADYDDRPDVILAVASADTDPELRDRLVAEFPEAFAQ